MNKWWIVGGALALVGGVVTVALVASAKQKAASLAPANNAGGTITPNATGDVVVRPGAMGTITMQSGPNGPTYDFMLPSLGTIQSIASDNPNVYPPVVGQSGLTSYSVSATMPGTAHLTITWALQGGPTQTTTFTLVGT